MSGKKWDRGTLVKRLFVLCCIFALNSTSVNYAFAQLSEPYRIGVSIRAANMDESCKDADEQIKEIEKLVQNPNRDKKFTPADNNAKILAIKALQHYEKEYNESRRENGQKIKLVFGGCQCHKKERVLAVIGQLFSDEVEQDAVGYETEKIIYISPAASRSSVTKGKKWVYSMMYPDNRQAEMMAYFVKHVLNAESIAVIYNPNNRYGSELRDGVLGVKSIFTSYDEIRDDGGNYREFVRSLVTSHLAQFAPETVIFLFTFPKRGAKIIQEIRSQGLEQRIICPESFYKDNDVIDYFRKPRDPEHPELGVKGANVYVATPFVKEFGEQRANQLRVEFEEELGESLTLYPVLAYEALGILTKAIEDKERIQGRIDRDALEDYLNGIDSSDKAVTGVLGPVFFHEHSVHRPVIITLPNVARKQEKPNKEFVDDGFRPMSIQVQEAFVNAKKGRGPQYVRNMVESGKLIMDEKYLNSNDIGESGKSVPEKGKYLKKIPVVYTSMVISQLLNDPDHKTMDIRYRHCLTWPHDVYEDKSELKVDLIDLIYPETISTTKVQAERGGYRNYPDHPGNRIHSHKCCERKATVEWNHDLSQFPFDFHTQRMKTRVGLHGPDAHEVILAVDTESLIEPKESQIKTGAEFNIIPSPEHPDCTYLEKPHKFVDPFTGKSLYYYTSVYEKQFVVKRNPSWPQIALLFLPLILAGILSWYVSLLYDTPLPGRALPVVIAFTILISIHGGCATQYKIPLVSLFNKCFLISYLIILGALTYAVLVERRSKQHMVVTTNVHIDAEKPSPREENAVVNRGENISDYTPDKYSAAETGKRSPKHQSRIEFAIEFLSFGFVVLVLIYMLIIGCAWIDWVRASAQ
jgi:ABC-type branched-subunit amino acid transport system substrate-binding protein